MNESWRTHEWSHVTHINESCHAYERVMSQGKATDRASYFKELETAELTDMVFFHVCDVMCVCVCVFVCVCVYVCDVARSLRI